ncbi:pentapeptide repeat-containing protein [Lusitaniella coriacea]|uniref:pentapeptide repeat-containing protein n=1 Tax=Lusitaniella coriacea TaxID=1983105 RepID=UPI003CEAE4EB
MQDSSPLTNLIAQNPYPDCLQLNLIPLSSNADVPIELSLSLAFNEQWEPLLNGRVKFGIKGGTLHLDVPAGTVKNSAISQTYSLSSPNSKTILLKITDCGTAHSAWDFSVCKGEPFLKGSLDSLTLATLDLSSHPTITFTVEPSDIYITDTEGLWKPDLSPNKHAVLERKLAQFLQQTRLSPYLSAVCSPSQTPTPQQKPENDSLEKLIQQIETAQTDNLLELAAMANLNPRQDFAGGNLLAVDCRGMDLSGSDFSRANLRGANLSDADLSEANLSGTRLSGVDLSGAYLENSNFNDADLHCASLALANLGGANLQGANLLETNLSNTNLSYAKLEGAKLGKNSGLSEEMKHDLVQRGAKA